MMDQPGLREPLERFSEPLQLLREDPGYHWAGLVIALVLGVLFASIHWVGLVVGGALLGLVATSLRRAVLAGLGFGVLVLVLWLVVLLVAGSLGGVLSMSFFPLLALAIGLLFPLLGSLVRGVV